MAGRTTKPLLPYPPYSMFQKVSEILITFIFPNEIECYFVGLLTPPPRFMGIRIMLKLWIDFFVD